MTATDLPVTPAFLRTFGFTGDETIARLEHQGPSYDGWVAGAIEVRRTRAGLVLTATVQVTNPTEAEYRRLCAAAGMREPDEGP